MKKYCLICILWCFLVCTLCTSCGLFDKLTDRGMDWAEDKQEEFFTALKNNDKEKVKSLLVEEKQELPEIDGQIDYLFEIFPKDTFEVHKVYMFPNSYGFCSSEVFVTSPSDNFRIEMDFSYSYTEAPSRGIQDIFIYNDKYCVSENQDDGNIIGAIHIHYTEEGDSEIKIIACSFYKYTHYDRIITLDEVKAFMKTKEAIAYGEFKEKFGLPNTEGSKFYELESADSIPLWIQLYVDDMGTDEDLISVIRLESRFDEYMYQDAIYRR